jgi:hypothetical protein
VPPAVLQPRVDGRGRLPGQSGRLLPFTSVGGAPGATRFTAWPGSMAVAGSPSVQSSAPSAARTALDIRVDASRVVMANGAYGVADGGRVALSALLHHGSGIKPGDRVLLAAEAGRRPAGRIVLRAGLRGEEVFALRLEDIDWRVGAVMVRGSEALDSACRCRSTSARRWPATCAAAARVATAVRCSCGTRPRFEVWPARARSAVSWRKPPLGPGSRARHRTGCGTRWPASSRT